LKKIVLFFIVLILYKVSFAQSNYYKLTLGVGVGSNTYYGDLRNSRTLPTYQVLFDYNVTPFVSAGVDIHYGSISAGDSLTGDQRFFKNSYTSVALNAKMQLGQLVNTDFSNFWYALKGIYVGTGVGVVTANQKQIVRTKINPDGSLYTFPGMNKSVSLLVPAQVGVNIDLPPDYWGYTRFTVSVNYSFNITFGENIDGYNDPKWKFQNNSPDMVGMATIGLKYTFGPEGLY
jgi:hypothetical protein